MQCDILSGIHRSLFSLLQASFWQQKQWKPFHADVVSLAWSIAQYCDYLNVQCKKVKLAHQSPTPVRTLADSMCVKYVKTCSSSCLPCFDALNQCLAEKQPYEHVFLNSFAPDDSRKRFEFLQSLERSGCQYPIVIVTHSPGNNAGNIHFAWRVSATEPVEDRSQSTIEAIKPLFPSFHTRAMRTEMFTKFGRVSPGTKPAVLRYFYRSLTGDASAPNDAKEAEIDARVQEVVSMEPEDPQTIIDLREARTADGHTKYQVFWDKASKFINEDIGTAVDDRRHSTVTHLAKAISLRDFRDQVKARLPEKTPVPNDEWLRLQFWPKSPNAHTSLQANARI